MEKIDFVVSGTAAQLGPILFRKLGKYRNEIFIKKLGWRHCINDGIESDEFDKEHTLYIIKFKQKKIVGCARLINTTNAYLLSDVFPFLSTKETLPKASSVWELSRFSLSSLPQKKIQPLDPFRLFFSEALYVAYLNGAKEILMVSPVAIKRIFNRINVKFETLGLNCWINDGYIAALKVKLNRSLFESLGIKNTQLEQN